MVGHEDIDRARSALSHLDPDCDRDTWVKYGMCVKHEFGEDGFELWDSWSSAGTKYSPSAVRSAWKSMNAEGKRTIASLFYDAKQKGWQDDKTHKKPTKAEIEARKAAGAARAEQAAQEEAEMHAKAAEWAQRLWDAAKPCESHPYLDRKGVASYGLRVGPWERIDEETGEVVVVANNALLLPICDRQRKLWSLQAIFVDPNAKKLYLKGGAKAGNFFPIGKPQQHDGRAVFILGEGYATCASVHAATGHMVLVCFDKSNLLTVARSLRERQPDAWIVFAADNDTHMDGNPGVTAARKAAQEVGGWVAVPPPGDFNDLQLSVGLGAVADCIEVVLHVKQSNLQPAEEPEREPQREPEIQTTLLTNGSHRDDVRRCLQQQENQNIQAIHAGAMIPSLLGLDEMLERCVLIALGGNVAYVTEERTMWLPITDFNRLTAASKTDIEIANQGGKIIKSKLTAELWSNDVRRKDVMSVTFRAGEPVLTCNPQGERCVNTWRPITRWPAKSDVAVLLEHLEYLFPDAMEREAFLDWLAHIEQRPGELPHYGWLHIASKTGTGRNWLASLLSRVFKGYVAPNVDLTALLESAFNGELGGRVLAIVDEIREGAAEGNYRHAERLKSMINAETRTINQKYGLKYTEFNACRWLIFSNHNNALPLSDSDRRFRVVMHDAEPRQAQVYERLYSLLKEPEFINAVGMFLRERDISQFRPGERPPMNAAKRAAIGASKSILLQNAEDIVKNWPADIITYKDATELLRGDSPTSPTNSSMRNAMEDAGAITWESNAVRRIKINGSPQRIWILRSHAKWLEQNQEGVRAEVNRAKVGEGRSASAVLADAVDLQARLNEPPI